ncbi:type VI secretion system membrane subunit TssM [uncultured Tateyamaria sp.]|uniref:type VI secretion system membrane subunit TssM n=1 Tax=uncultured Tateyamaria sp. TaxID=455651 RepID=UPI0026259C0F|nr:type VI secretion system membrane subunit TssM [uncultured Tateyamaria sp.]
MRVVRAVFAVLTYLVGAVALSASIWVGLPLLGNDVLALSEVRAALIGAILLSLLLVALLRHRARRKSAQALERSLMDAKAGDGAILAERMQGAVAKLKEAGGATALYDLPWYVLIGPPGAGKTTALVHSGLDFPDTDPGAVAGFGGTRNCDFWFARDAVLVDTAGRYTTQDSDATADRASWAAFLEQLKTARPDQPINGVILALSCADLLTADEATLRGHADTVRARLAEVHSTLRTHVPVYVMFTKADMIAGFRQYFGAFDELRRRGVWGVTFQTRDRAHETWRTASAEYARLVRRLSDEVTDRMAEELDSATRIAIFGFPAQMALLETRVTDFLQGVFEDASANKAILRGFYFTSGTQEGTPIDQVLGARAGAGGLQPSFMSGRGRSYFLHDLLKKVIFAERDWVGYDRARMLRRALFRGFAKTVIVTASLAAMAAFGYSFWKNASLVREADAQASAYATRAAPLLTARYVENAATRPLLPALAAVRVIPAGYADPRPQSQLEQLGLSRRATLRGAAVDAYSDSLERLLRPRMMLLAERRLGQALIDADHAAAYRALKVYILLAKEQDGRDDDLAIQSFFAEAWSREYAVSGSDTEYRAINAHLSAMLALDDRVSPPIKPNKALVDRARLELSGLPLAVQVMSAIEAEAGVLSAWSLGKALPDPSGLRLVDGRDPATLVVPGLFTFEGYWSAFQQALVAAPAYVEADAWVLARGPASATQRGALVADVHALYAARFEAVWSEMLSRIDGASAMSVAPSLARVVAVQTRLSAVLDPDPMTGGDSSALKNIRDLWGGVAVGELRRRAEAVQRPFAPWFAAVREQGGATPVDLVVRDVTGLASDPARWPVVTARAAAMPAPIQRMVADVGLGAAQAALRADVTGVCRARIAPFYPFGGPIEKPLPVVDFAAFFGYGGHVDRYWATYAGQGDIALPMSDMARRDFDAMARMRGAVFPDSSAVPDMTLSLRIGGVSADVVSIDVDLGNGAQRLVSGGPGIAVQWPSDVRGMRWSVNAGEANAAELELKGGAWAIVEALRVGSDVQTNGAGAEATHTVGPHAFRMMLGAAEGAAPPPFVGPIWSDFTCLDTLE